MPAFSGTTLLLTGARLNILCVEPNRGTDGALLVLPGWENAVNPPETQDVAVRGIWATIDGV
jgi:hypothetical protein